MKTAISLPDELFDAVERIVRRSGRHRSEVYADALREYVARHTPEEMTEAINRALQEVGDSPSEYDFAAAAARGTLENSEW
jgi:metal-responsive CopG/Arc/MetJ family transcriptional regulator